ncbi:hypothetical protein CCACVL1_23995 [Corchorus capsularis]|uniref:Uncharacterized protein n=1 Tax=Corchorus capsularis TaxID=210143 RepID=A0A1R3GRD6_COCAP|nr:hypothetical protein CCACVL1_23995 [Corchorus capsularis]
MAPKPAQGLSRLLRQLVNLDSPAPGCTED